MINLTLKNLVAHRRRALSTVLAIVAGVAFLSGTLIFSDTLTASMNRIVADGNAGADAVIRAPETTDVQFGQNGALIPASLLAAVEGLPQVGEASVRVSGYAQLVGPDGAAVVAQSDAATLGFNWIEPASLNPFRLTEGRAPLHDGEVVIDRASAERSRYRVGDAAPVLTNGENRTFTIAGIADYGDRSSQGGAGAVLFRTSTAEELLTTPGQVDSIVTTAAAGVSERQLVDALDERLNGVEVLTSDQLIAENQRGVDQEIGPFRTFLLVFAAIALFVAAFIINNTFSITVAQRSKEMAMLRALGASRRQVVSSVVLEAFVVGTLAGAIGVGAGLGIAKALKILIQQLNVVLPPGPIVIEPRSLVVSFAVGLVVAMLSAYLPARGAGRIPPIQALRNVSVESVGNSRRRLVVGAGAAATGAGLMFVGQSNRLIGSVGLGSFTVFVAALALAPVCVGPAARILGLPFAVVGVSGEIATQNAMRNSRRTARTAGALMVGVSLVSFMAVFGASLTTSFGSSFEKNFHGTHVIDSGVDGGSGGFSNQLGIDLRSAPGISESSQFRLTKATIDGESDVDLEGYDAASIGQLIDLGDVDGDLASLGTDGIAIDRGYAKGHDLELGSTVDVGLATGPKSFTVRALFDGSEWLGSQFIDIAAFDAALPQTLTYRIYVTGTDEAVEAAVADYPSADVLDRAEFIELVSGTIQQFLGVIYALLMLAVLIALIGVGNALSLAIFERTREIGLLRAVGMTRRQLGATIRVEAIITALLGTTSGISIGTLFGWTVVRTLVDEGFDTVTIPVVPLVIIAAAGAIAGGLVATLPARRAARLNILDALGTV